jgi:hypothetical protein
MVKVRLTLNLKPKERFKLLFLHKLITRRIILLFNFLTDISPENPSARIQLGSVNMPIPMMAIIPTKKYPKVED